MKKRASLLISGITTVALVVTAIGSFAAWDTLTGSTTDDILKVSVSNPVVLAVTDTKIAAQTTKLAPNPINGDITDTTTRAQAITVGTFKASLKNTDTVALLKTTYTATITGGNTELYDVKIFDGESEVVASTGLELKGEPKDFTVKVSVKADADEAKLKADAGQELKVDINLTTAKTS